MDAKFIIAKILELIIIFICFILRYVCMGRAFGEDLGPICISLGGYAIICSVLLAGIIMDAKVEDRMNAFFGLTGCIMFIGCGCIIIHDWNHGGEVSLNKNDRHYGLSIGSLMIINGVLFLLELGIE